MHPYLSETYTFHHNSELARRAERAVRIGTPEGRGSPRRPLLRLVPIPPIILPAPSLAFLEDGISPTAGRAWANYLLRLRWA